MTYLDKVSDNQSTVDLVPQRAYIMLGSKSSVLDFCVHALFNPSDD